MGSSGHGTVMSPSTQMLGHSHSSCGQGCGWQPTLWYAILQAYVHHDLAAAAVVSRKSSGEKVLLCRGVRGCMPSTCLCALPLCAHCANSSATACCSARQQRNSVHSHTQSCAQSRHSQVLPLQRCSLFTNPTTSCRCHDWAPSPAPSCLHASAQAHPQTRFAHLALQVTPAMQALPAAGAPNIRPTPSSSHAVTSHCQARART